MSVTPIPQGESQSMPLSSPLVLLSLSGLQTRFAVSAAVLSCELQSVLAFSAVQA